LRNSVSERFPIDVKEITGPVILQEIVYNEGGFSVLSVKVPEINDFQIRVHRLGFEHVEGGLEIAFWTES